MLCSEQVYLPQQGFPVVLSDSIDAPHFKKCLIGVSTSSVHCEVCGLWLAGKAAGITAAGLLAGVLLGAALQSWLRVDIVPIAVIPPVSPAQRASRCKSGGLPIHLG